MGALFIAGVVAIATIFVNDKFTSSSVFIPVNASMIDRFNVFSKESMDKQVYYFGGKDDINRVISIAESFELYDYLIDKF